MPDENAKRRRRSGFTVGLGVGVVLFLPAFLIVGAGEGPPQPVILSGSPFSLVGAGLLAAPLFWALAGWIAGSPHHHRITRMAGVVLFALHYLVGGFVVVGADNAAWIGDAQRTGPLFVGWFVAYVLAHVAFWIEFASTNGRFLPGP